MNMYVSIQKYGDFLFFCVKFQALNLRYTTNIYVSIEAQELDRGPPAAPPALIRSRSYQKFSWLTPKLEYVHSFLAYDVQGLDCRIFPGWCVCVCVFAMAHVV